MYTLTGMNGERDLRLEQGLSGLESEFARIRRDKLAKHGALQPGEHFLLCLSTRARLDSGSIGANSGEGRLRSWMTLLSG
jgi:hypothetical protein